MKKILFSLFLSFFFTAGNAQGVMYDRPDVDKQIVSFNNITLEMSLKPFKENSVSCFEEVCHTLFEQWKPLLLYTDTVSVLLWVADGSEILDYRGDLNQPLEWARYIGNPNTGKNDFVGMRAMGNEDQYSLYMDSPPSYVYQDLKTMISVIKKVGKEILGKPIRVGETFDPGPEFSISDFKYKKHPEICMGATMGKKSMICCYAILNGDESSYASYPEGIPQGTPFGTFFGKQSQAFLTDMGFDYIWLSNGFGFGMETWASTGAIFDGKEFHREKLPEIHSKIVDFWSRFRKECPDFRIETRGTNITSGADLAKDGVDLRAIYTGKYNLLPPPNSPWAAINYNLGLEMAGYMSRIAEIPDNRYLFRFYPHDPWWAFCPWINNYGREPYDIYLPLSVASLDNKGNLRLPTHLNFLAVNDSYGNMPDQIPNEIIPHILQSRRCAPDKAAPLIWVYPFDEYYDWAQKMPDRLEEIFYGDWFIQQAINDGFPLNTVISTRNLANALKEQPDKFNSSVLLSIVPDEGCELERHLLRFVKSGGNLILYGPISHAGAEFKKFMNVKVAKPIEGVFDLALLDPIDRIEKPASQRLRHQSKWSGGGVECQIDNKEDKSTRVLARITKAEGERVASVLRTKPEWNGGSVVYVRGTNSASYQGGHLLVPDNPEEWFDGNHLLRDAMDRLGYQIRYDKIKAGIENPINCISKSNNAYFFSGYTPNQTVNQRMRFPYGIPLLTETDIQIKEGFGIYRMPRSFFKECRVFVEQREGVVSCKDRITQNAKVYRRIKVTGLDRATVRIFPPCNVQQVEFVNQPIGSKEKNILFPPKVQRRDDIYYEIDNVSGDIEVAFGVEYNSAE